MEVVDTRGIGSAKRLVAEFLAAELPGYLGELRTLWELDDVSLPVPTAFDHNEPQALDRWPRVSVVGVAAKRVRSEHQVDAEIAYVATYTLRAFVWVRDSGWDRTLDTRDDLTAAVSTLLLDRQTLGQPDVLVLEDTLAEEYSDIQPVRGDRYVAGSYVGFDLRRVEALRRDRSGTVATVKLDTVALPPHPALA